MRDTQLMKHIFYFRNMLKYIQLFHSKPVILGLSQKDPGPGARPWAPCCLASLPFTACSRPVADPRGGVLSTSTHALQCYLGLTRLASALMTSVPLALPRCRGDAVCWASVGPSNCGFVHRPAWLMKTRLTQDEAWLGWFPACTVVVSHHTCIRHVKCRAEGITS